MLDQVLYRVSNLFEMFNPFCVDYERNDVQSHCVITSYILDLIHSLRSRSYDRSVVSCRAISPQSVI